MEATPALPAGADDWAARFAAALGAQRERIRAFLAAQQARLSRTEAQLRDQGRALKELLQREARQVEQAQQTLEQRRAELDRREAELERLSSQLSVQREQWEDLCRQTAAQNTALGEQWRRQQAEWFSQLAEQQAALDAQWRSRQAAFEEQCRIEQENWHQLRSRQQAELESVREELERRRAELDRQRVELERQRTEWERQRTDWETRRVAAADNDAHRIEEVQERFDAIRRDALAAALTEEATAPSGGEPSAATDDGQAEDYRRRYEMALEDLRHVKARNAELQQEVAQLRSSSGTTEGVLNWELEKQKILAALEAEAQRESISPEERIEVRQIVARTDQLLAEKDRLLAEKDREIEELKALLENQSGNLGSVAVGAAALGEMFDQDAVIQEHRAHLEQLQAELQEKMRQAEIEISLERAKLARERAKLEEQMRALPPAAEPPAGEKPDRGGRGRWRAQLGIGGEQPTP